MNQRPAIAKPYRLHVLNRVPVLGLHGLSDICDTTEDFAAANALVLRSDKPDLKKYPILIAIARAGIGVDNIDVEYASSRGIPVFYAPGGNAHAVTELVFAALGMYVRNVGAAIDYVRSIDMNLPANERRQRIEKEKEKFRGTELTGKILGVVGMGNIGSKVALVAANRGMEVIGYDPFIPQLEWQDRFVDAKRASTLEELMRRCDIVSVHVDLNGKTKHLINGAVLEHAKQDLILVNYARDEVCDDDAVIAALDAGRLRGYLQDFPWLGSTYHAKVQPTPHLGASTVEAEALCASMVARQLSDFLRYGIVVNAKNFPDMDVRPHENCPMRLCIPHRDVPGMLKLITDTIGEFGINISAFHNETKNGIGYCVVDLAATVGDEVLDTIEDNDDILGVRALYF